MKSFKEVVRENLNEGQDRYPGDDMTQKELKIAINAAKNILDMIEDGSMLMRWQISAIVKASEELASVCTSMRADEEEGDEEWGEYDSPFSMYGESKETFIPLSHVKKHTDAGKTVKYHVLHNGRDAAGRFDDYESAKKGAAAYRSQMRKRGFDHKGVAVHPVVSEELDFKVSVDGLPDMYVKANSPSEVKANLRKVVKKPDSIRSVDRVTRNMVRKVFRDKAAGKEEMQEGYNDPIHRKYISDAVHEYVSKDDPKHDKIVDHLHKAKNFGLKTSDSLESHAGVSTGTAMRVTKAVAAHLKANFGSPSKTQTQAQRVDRYLKQKWVKPR
jgi:hypothetical protein